MCDAHAQRRTGRARGGACTHCICLYARRARSILRRLRELGIKGLAVGAFGGASEGAFKLLDFVATTGAAERWRDAMAPSPLGYRSVLVAQLRRVWGCFFARENARLKLARLALATGAGHRTHAARGLNRAQRARRDAGFFLFHSFGARGAAPSWRTGGG